MGTVGSIVLQTRIIKNIPSLQISSLYSLSRSKSASAEVDAYKLNNIGTCISINEAFCKRFSLMNAGHANFCDSADVC
jgi:hypothetical protein